MSILTDISCKLMCETVSDMIFYDRVHLVYYLLPNRRLLVLNPFTSWMVSLMICAAHIISRAKPTKSAMVTDGWAVDGPWLAGSKW